MERKPGGWASQMLLTTVLTLYVTPSELAINADVTISGYLKDGFGNGLGGRTVTWFDDRYPGGGQVERIAKELSTRDDGSFDYKYGTDQPGRHLFMANFQGDNNYAESYSNPQMVTWKLRTKLTLTSLNWTPKPGDTFLVRGWLIDEKNGASLKDQRVKFYTWHKGSTEWTDLKDHRTGTDGHCAIVVHVTKEDEDPLFIPNHDDAIWDAAQYKATFFGTDLYLGSESKPIFVIPDT
jgi:hypothetical protein